ncbi:hypothetical protein D9M70_529490 [compost metagenome]
MSVVEDRAFDDGTVDELGLAVLGHHVVPAEAFAFAAAVGVDQGAVLVLFAGLAWQADADQALAGGEDNTAIGFVPSVALVLAHHRKLHAVDG